MASNFSFSRVPDVRVGLGSTGQLAGIAKALRVQAPIIITDEGIVDLGLLNTAVSSLTTTDARPTIFSGVVADPPESILFEALSTARKNGCDGVIGFGGGSSMDVAKVLSVLMAGDQNLGSMYGVDKVIGARMPLIQIPTTAGTGSEATMVSVITTGKTTKAGIVSRTLLADAVILDARLTFGLPPSITAATGIDAMVHAIESFTSVRLKNPMSDFLALKALRLLSTNIRTVMHQSDNAEARQAMLFGAMCAGEAFANAPVAAVHALAYPLGGNYHIPHGLTNSLVLPHVLRYNSPQADELYDQLVPVILGADRPYADKKESALVLAEYFTKLAKELGLPTTLQQMNISKYDLPRLAKEAMTQTRLLINNPRFVSEKDALKIYQQAF
jgi:alcohol dehydrogenase